MNETYDFKNVIDQLLYIDETSRGIYRQVNSLITDLQKFLNDLDAPPDDIRRVLASKLLEAAEKVKDNL